MKIQKGIVKYKERDDYICTYGITEDNRQYFFLDPEDKKKFSNGNRIASKDLKEAIDPMVKATQVGVIDENGNEVIPFNNRSIRPINDDIMLVEPANPVSESVINANNLKSNPEAATQLVSTPALIKEKINSQMGADGRYVFNDQFSEATVCDINGNNLVNNEYYSFIGQNNDKLFFSKNIPNSPITEYSILPPEVQSDITPTNDTNEINVNNVEVPQEVVENAFVDAQTVGNNTTPVENNNEQVVEQEVPVASANNVVPDTVPTVPATDIPQEAVPVENTVEQPANENNFVNDITGDNIQNMVARETLGTEIPPIVEADNVNENVNIEDNNINPVVNQETAEVPTPTEEVSNEVAPAENTIEQSMNLDSGITVVPPVSVEPTTVEIPETPVEENVEPAPTVPEENNVVEAPTEESNAPEENTVEEEVNTVEEKEEVSDINNAQETTVEETSVNENEEIKDIFKEDNEIEENIEHESDFDVDMESEVVQKVKPASKKVKIPYSSIVPDYPDDYEEEREDTLLDQMVENKSFEEDDFDRDMEEDNFSHEIRTDRIVHNDYVDEYEDNYRNSSRKDSVMQDVAKSLSSLMRQNKELKASLAEYKDKNEKLMASRRNIADRAKVLEQKNDILNTKLHNEETLKNKATNKVMMLEEKLKDLERIITSQEKELEVLRPQVSGRDELIKLVQDANLLLGNDNTSYDYEDNDSYYRRAA